MNTTTRLLLVLCLIPIACGDPAPKPAPPAQPAATHDDCGDDHGHGPPVAIGTKPCGPFTVQASRDEGGFKAGCDVPVDVVVTGGPKVSAVRFWFGAEDGKGALKARAEIENPNKPDHWHSHVELPDPLPKPLVLWVEIEGAGDVKATCSFAL